MQTTSQKRFSKIIGLVALMVDTNTRANGEAWSKGGRQVWRALKAGRSFILRLRPRRHHPKDRCRRDRFVNLSGQKLLPLRQMTMAVKRFC